MPLKNKLEVISQEDLSRIHEGSLKLLEETGIVFQSTEALDTFKKHGAKVEGQTVYISNKMVENALGKCSSTYKWQARNEVRSVTVGEGFLIQPNAGPVYIQDLDQGRRLAKLEDYSNIMKLCQASDTVNLVGAHPVDPSDVQKDHKHLYMMNEILKNTDKPVLGFVVDCKQAGQMLDMLEIATGGSLTRGHFAGVSVNPLSPLRWATDTTETIIEYAKRNQAVFLLPCIMAGISGPVSLLGTAVLQNTEILSGLVLTKLINPSAPVVYSPSSTAGYLKKGSYSTGTPEGMLINMANLQLALDYYHLPTRTMCGMTDSKSVDCQAGYETMQNLMMGMLSGAHIIVECLGVLDAIMTTSYEKFVIDEEILNRVMRIAKGIYGNNDLNLSLDVIREVGHNGNYLAHSNTFQHFRDRWTPSLADWDSYADWQETGSEDILVRANRKFKKILDCAPETMIDEELANNLRAYMQKAGV